MRKCGAASPLFACSSIKTFGGINPSGVLTCWSYAYFTFWINPLNLKRRGDAKVLFADISRIGATLSEVVEKDEDPRLTVDVVKGRGSGFSVEAPEGIRFLIRSELFSEAEDLAMEAEGPPPRGPGAMEA